MTRMVMNSHAVNESTLRSSRIPSVVRRALGALLPLIDSPHIRDVLVQVRAGKGEAWADTGVTLTRVPHWECSPETVGALARELISAGNRHLDEREPIADVHIGGGIRVHAVLPPVSAAGAAISIRLPTAERPDLTTLLQRGLCDPVVGERLISAVHAQQNILVVGGAGTGKTTLLAALLNTVPQSQRIVTIEDVSELQLSHPHHISLESRQSNAEGIGEITLDQLLRAALRMRPDRIVLGECRGPELVTLLTAFNTGHNGGAGTLHASSLGDVAARLEALGALAGLSPEALSRQVVSAIHLIVHLERDGTGVHRITGMGVPALRNSVLQVRER